MRRIYFVILLFIAGCSMQPTSSNSIVDDNPRLTFKISSELAKINADVVIDGISYGPVDQFLVGKNTVAIIDGKHKIEIVVANEVIYSTTMFLGTNTTTTIEVIHD
jgi:PBP1b-binding outer membrane lipoprotein LpoB